eukprot:247086_1
MVATEVLYMSLAVGLTVLGSIGNALGYVWQKKGHLLHIETNEIREIQDDETESILKNKTWVIGFFVCLFGSILTAAAFKFGAQSLLAPLSALVLVCNAMFANKILGEPFTKQNLYGIILVIIGSVIAVIFGPKSSTAPVTLSYIETCWRNPIFLIFFISLTLLFIIDYAFVRLLEKKNAKSIQLTHTIEHGANFMMISYIGLAAYFGSVNVLFMKSFMIILGSFSISYFANYLFYITIIGIVIVNVLLEMFRQTAIKFFDARYVVPIFQVMLILGAAMMGAIFFGEFASLSTIHLTLFIIAIFITVLGVAVLAFQIGSLYKTVLKKLDEKIGSSFSITNSKQQLSLRTRARKSFSNKTHRQTQLLFPAFYGPAAAVNYARECTLRDTLRVDALDIKHFTDPKDSPYTEFNSPNPIQLKGFPDTKAIQEHKHEDNNIEALDDILMDCLDTNNGTEKKQKSKHYKQISQSESATLSNHFERIKSQSIEIETLNTVDEEEVEKHGLFENANEEHT